MIIRQVVLHNFGVYAGTNVFDFSAQKPVALIGGMNGRGKTTFLEAILIALYGANSFAYQESEYQTYGQYLRAFVNVSDDTLISYVELEIEIEEDDTTYRIKREWNALKKRTKEFVDVDKNGEHDVFLTNNWLLFIESMLPSALSPYFFFDGDNIAELAASKTDNRMKESIKALLGISILDTLQSDLNKIDRQVNKKRTSNVDMQELPSLRRNMENDKADLEEIDDELSLVEQKIEGLNKKLEKKHAEYISRGGIVVEQRHDLYEKKALLTARLDQNKQRLIEIASSALPLGLVRPLLEEIESRAIKEKQDNEMRIVANNVELLAKEFSEEEPNMNLDTFISYLNKRAAGQETEPLYDVSDSFIYQITALCSTQLNDLKSAMVDTMNNVTVLKGKIEKIDRYLSVDVDEIAVNKIFKDIKALEQNIIAEEERINRLNKQRSECNGRYMRSASKYNYFVEEMLTTLELSDDADRILKYAGLAERILDVYKVRLQERKVAELTETITLCYKKISNKKNLISKIEMDSSTLDFIYLDRRGKPVSKSSLSEGEKQMMIISILWALAVCSKRNLPVIIDTPLARLDSSHRKALIDVYFPNASVQTIILSTDSEIYGEYYELMKKHVGDEFTLVYDDQTNSTTVHNGYFRRES